MDALMTMFNKLIVAFGSNPWGQAVAGILAVTFAFNIFNRLFYGGSRKW